MRSCSPIGERCRLLRHYGGKNPEPRPPCISLSDLGGSPTDVIAVCLRGVEPRFLPVNHQLEPKTRLFKGPRVEPAMLVTYLAIYLPVGFAMNAFGKWSQIAEFGHWGQVVTCYG